MVDAEAATIWDPRCDIDDDGDVDSDDLTAYAAKKFVWPNPSWNQPTVSQAFSDVGNPYMFQGVPHFAIDTEASATSGKYMLNHHRARFADPVTGRWVTRDPLLYYGEVILPYNTMPIPTSEWFRGYTINTPVFNIYEIVHSHVTNWSDPSGLFPVFPFPSIEACCCLQIMAIAPPGAEAATVCCSGRPLICLIQSQYTHSGFLKCIMRHEEHHKASCKCNPGWNPIISPCIETPRERSGEECEAYGVEVACLQEEQQADCGNSQACNEAYECRIWVKCFVQSRYCRAADIPYAVPECGPRPKGCN